MSHSAKCAALVARFSEVLDVWEVPVTVAEICAADPSISKYMCASALKQMVAHDLLYTTTVLNSQLAYFPVSKRPVCLIQEYLCKGRIG